MTRLYYEDEKVIVVDCKIHHKPMIVLRRHTQYPTAGEEAYMRGIMEQLFPQIKLRGPRSIYSHYHLHQV